MQEELLGENELYRPKIHFTPKNHWMNDPNGMFYLNGTYHLYYQYYPDGNVWGPMHWGHATSEDLISWKEHAIALYPDELGYIFSGSAVVDYHNTSGFGDGTNVPIIAIFTHHDPEGEQKGQINFQTQSIAYSLDEGFTWTKYEGNPVVPNPGIKDFRDPKVVWDTERSHWLMILSTYAETLFYSSKNLKEWNYVSSFGKDFGAHGGVWECPDFFRLTIKSTGETKWVLLQSINPGAPNGGSGTQYFVGDFDGNQFTIDKRFQKQLQSEGAIWVDYGRDNYAGVTWSNIPENDGRRITIAWMSNWDYAREVPTEQWRGSMTIPRELSLTIDDQGDYVLTSIPVEELNSSCEMVEEVTEVANVTQYDISKDKFEATLFFEIELSDLKEDSYVFSWSNNTGDVLKFGLDNKRHAFFVDKTNSGTKDFSKSFYNIVSKHDVKRRHQNIKLTILIDKTSVEIFANDGELVFTEIFFPSAPMTKLAVASKTQFTIHNLKTYKF
ncbi:MAG: glycoside hydrolase family 32 protein [Bacteroidota bacterium]